MGGIVVRRVGRVWYSNSSPFRMFPVKGQLVLVLGVAAIRGMPKLGVVAAQGVTTHGRREVASQMQVIQGSTRRRYDRVRNGHRNMRVGGIRSRKRRVRGTSPLLRPWVYLQNSAAWRA